MILLWASICVAASFWVGWWRARVELVGDPQDVYLTVRSVARVSLDQTTIEVTFAFIARTDAGLVVECQPTVHIIHLKET